MMLLALLSLLARSAVSIPTCTQIQQMKTAIYTLDSLGVDNAALVRLGFHDCVGGCNSCINFNNPANNGLQPAVTALNNIYTSKNFKSFGVSRADFWAMAATVALSSAVRDSNRQRNNGMSCTASSCPGPCPVPCMPLRWGRVDAATCTNEPPLPSATMTAAAMYTYFQQQFGFSKAQVVTIMGAHSLGGADPANSGYSGKFTGPSNNGFSEIYYKQLLNRTINWANVNPAPAGSPAKWQFSGKSVYDNSDAGFLLNTDVELYYDLTLDANAKTTCKLSPLCGLGGTGACTGYCPAAYTGNQALAYALDCGLFMNDFVITYDLMLTNKNPNLLLSPSCCPL